MTEFSDWRSIGRIILGEGRKGLALGAMVALGLASAYGLMQARSRDALFAITPGEMPGCNSPVVRRGLLQTAAASPAARLKGFAILKIVGLDENVPEAGPNPDRRACIARVLTNAGRDVLFFTLTWAGAEKDDVYLEIPGGLR